MRPGDKDGITYHFRTRKEIEGFRDRPNFIIFPVRDDLQALDMNDIKKAIKEPDAIGFLEVFHTLGAKLTNHPYLKGVDVDTVFLSPLTSDEIYSLQSSGGNELLESALFSLMQEKLKIRTLKQKGVLRPEDLKNIERRAGTAFAEMKSASYYKYILPNHDGEGSPNWGTKQAFGDAAKVLKSFVDILMGHEPAYYEKWDATVLF